MLNRSFSRKLSSFACCCRASKASSWATRWRKSANSQLGGAIGLLFSAIMPLWGQLMLLI
jgi:hypothetical protein